MLLPEDCIQKLVQLSEVAGQAVLEVYESEDFGIEQKSDESPLTRADIASNKTIMEGLHRILPDIPVISEELKFPDIKERQSWAQFWLVDPLDGTKEFIKKNGEFTVNIALIDGGIPVLGVIHVPVTGVTYFSEKGKGAWKKQASTEAQRIYCSDWDPSRPAVVVGSRSHKAQIPEGLEAKLIIKERRSVGSSLKFILLAEGEVDVYARFSPCMEWDVAAGDCIFRNSARNGQNPSPLTYNTESLKIESFVLGFDRMDT